MPADVDLRAVEIPAEKSSAEFTPQQRRADLLARVESAGAPSALPPQTELGRQYGVTQSVISEDLNHHVAPYVRDSLDSPRGF